MHNSTHLGGGAYIKDRIRQLEEALETVLDCYAAQIPTDSERLDEAKALIRWEKEKAAVRYLKRWADVHNT